MGHAEMMDLLGRSLWPRKIARIVRSMTMMSDNFLAVTLRDAGQDRDHRWRQS